MGKIYRHKFKAVICDVDGTLVSNKFNGKLTKNVSQSVIKALNKVSIGIATGRALERVLFLFEELGLKQPCIINGGAQIVHPVTKKILWEKKILLHDIKNITPIMDKLKTNVWVVDKNKEFLYSKGLQLAKPISFFIPRIEERIADKIINTLSLSDTLALNKVVAYSKGCIALHITHAEATKKHASQKVAELMSLDKQDIIGVGDGYNDYPLFKACGFKVAVENAVPELKKAADYVAPSVHDDGVAHVLEKFVLN